MRVARTILITGCSSGIGWDAAVTLVRHGWRVFATARDDHSLARLADVGANPVHMEMSDDQSIAVGWRTVMEQTDGTLDALYNNAAFACPGAVEDLPTGAIRAVFDANVFGLHGLTRLAIPIMRAQGHGRIVQCSSVLGFVPMRWRGAYVGQQIRVGGSDRYLADRDARKPPFTSSRCNPVRSRRAFVSIRSRISKDGWIGGRRHAGINTRGRC